MTCCWKCRDHEKAQTVICVQCYEDFNRLISAAQDAHRGMTEAKWSEELRSYLAARLESALAALERVDGKEEAK